MSSWPFRVSNCASDCCEEVTQRFAPTVLEGGVLHSVRAVSLVCDVAVCFGTGGIDHVNLHVVPSSLLQRASIHDEVGGDISEDPWRYGRPVRSLSHGCLNCW